MRARACACAYGVKCWAGRAESRQGIQREIEREDKVRPLLNGRARVDRESEGMRRRRGIWQGLRV